MCKKGFICSLIGVVKYFDDVICVVVVEYLYDCMIEIVIDLCEVGYGLFDVLFVKVLCFVDIVGGC